MDNYAKCNNSLHARINAFFGNVRYSIGELFQKSIQLIKISTV